MGNESTYEDGGVTVVERSVDSKGSTSGRPSSEEKPKRRRRAAKIITEKKFDCKHPGCGRQYSRAEHLYRHQLNRKPSSITYPGEHVLIQDQTIPSRYFGVIIQIAIANLSVRIYVFGIEKGILPMAPNYKDETLSPKVSTALLHW